jgi:hypothetical protein
MTRTRRIVLEWLLRVATAGAFIGHGAYGAVLQKAGWYPFLAQFGIDEAVARAYALPVWLGGLEIALGLWALIRPTGVLLAGLVAMKILTEFVWYPMVGHPVWEFVERWANYAAPLALLIVRTWPRFQAAEFH